MMVDVDRWLDEVNLPLIHWRSEEGRRRPAYFDNFPNLRLLISHI